MTIHCDGVVINPKDYPTQPPLNRKCHEGNIHQTILVEYDTLWPDGDCLELYFRVYHSISNRILRKIIRKGLEEAKKKQYEEENIVQTIASYLPSGLPVGADGMKTMAKELVDRRWKKRLEEEAELQKDKDMMELSRCLICRGIELVLKTSELKVGKNFKTHEGNAIDDGAETHKTRKMEEKRQEEENFRSRWKMGKQDGLCETHILESQRI
jgi:hypothetical protein